MKRIIKESGIRDINNLLKRYKEAKIYFHQDLDGVTTGIAMKKYLENQGFKVVDCEIIQYGEKEWAIKKPEGEGTIMPVLVDFAHGKPMFEIHTDHHDSQVGVEKETKTSFKHSRSNVETISQTISPKDLFKDEDLFVVSTIDSANFAANQITTKMVMNFIFKYDKDQSVKRNKLLMGLVLNKLLLAYKNDKVDGRDLLEYLVMKCEPSLENLYNTLTKVAKEKGFASAETMQQNQKKYIEDRSKEGVIQKEGGVLYQFGLGSMKKGSYDRYTPFDLNPDADFLVTGLGAPVGLVQASCNPYKADRELKGVDLGKIKDEVLLSFKPELEKVILPYKIIKKVSEKKATADSVGFTQKDMDAIYGSMPSFDPKTNTISAYDYLVANAGGHKCITTISGIGFVYSGYDKPYTKDLPAEAIPIAFYEGSNTFIQDIKQKLLRFRKLSEKQIQAAISGMKREGIDVESLANPKQGRGTTELTKDIRDKFVEILNQKIASGGEKIQESKSEDTKKYYVDKSKLGGKGVFAKKDIKKGETIGLLHTIKKMGSDYDFTELGRMHNHKDEPSCHNKKIDNKRYLVASKNIKKGEELTTDYRLQPDLEQPQDWFKGLKENEEKMWPQKDGYRTYSPFKDLDYIIVDGDGIDCDNIVYDLILIGNNGSFKFCKKNSGSHYLEGADRVVEIPLKDNENGDYLLNNKKVLVWWLEQKLKKIDLKGEIKRKIFDF